MNLKTVFLLVTFALLASVYSFTTPLFEGPDEIWHFAFADHLAQGRGLPVLQISGQDIWLRNAAHPPLYHLLVAAVIAPIDRSDFPAAYRFNLASPRITPGSVSRTPNLLIHTAHEDFPFQQSALAAHLGRLVSVVLSTLALWGTWRAARLLLPQATVLPIWATLLVAFIPQLVYQAGLINNDALAVAAATWLVVGLLQLMRAPTWRWAIFSGVLLGLTLLAKIGLLILLPLPVVALALAHWPTRTQSPALKRWLLLGLLIYLVALLVAGWWYARNFMLYGDPLAWRQWQALAGAKRLPPTLLELFNDALGFFGMFWVDFTLRADRAWAWVFWLLSALAVGGLGVRWRTRTWPTVYWPGLALAASAFLLLLAAAAAYALSITEIHGRLVHPALPFIGVVLALGLSGWGPRLAPWVLRAAGSVLVGFSLLAAPLLIAPAYARPTVAQVPAPASVTPIAFGPTLELVGYQPLTPAASAQPGQTLALTTYWRTLAAQPDLDHYQVLALVQPNGQIAGHLEEVLGSPLYPSGVWLPSDIVQHTLSVPIDANVQAPTLANLELTVHPSQSLTPLNTHILGQVRLTTHAPCVYAVAHDAVFGEQIRLLGYTLTDTGLTLCWQALQPIAADYTVFVHLFDAQGQPQGAADGPPRGGNYPTSVWQPGEQIPDPHLLSPIAGGSLTLGLYRLDTGERLWLNASEETEVKIETGD